MNTPNKISLARICMIPLVIFFYLANFIPWGKFIAGVLFIIACFTDFVDGYLARKNNQVTNLGKFLDSIADKILIMTAIVLIVSSSVVNGSNGLESIIRPQWLGILCGIIILMREFVVSALRQIAASKGKVLAAEKSGKIKAVFQYVTFSLYFFYAFYVVEFYNGSVNAHKVANTVLAIIMLVLLVLTTILTITSGVGYLYKNRHVFLDEKQEEVQENMVLFVENKPDEVKEKPVIEEKPKQTKPRTTTKKKSTQTKKKPAPKPQPASTNVVDSRGREYDALIPQALEMFWEKGWASTTMLQKQMGVGYPRASKIVDQMEELGLISSNEGAKTRLVLVTKEEFEKNNKIFK